MVAAFDVARVILPPPSKNWGRGWGGCRLDYQPLFGKGARAPPNSTFNVPKSAICFVAHLACIPVSVKSLPYSHHAKIRESQNIQGGRGMW